MALNEDRFERVSELFYEAAGIPETWPDALDALADASGASGAVLLPVRPGQSKAISSRGISELVARQVSEGWHPSNPRLRRGLELTDAGWLGLITDRDMFGTEGLPASDYSAFLERHGFGWVAGMVLARAGHDLVVSLSLERRLDLGPFRQDEIVSLNRLMAQLRPAAALAVRIGFAGAKSFADGVAAVGEDAVLIGDLGKVLYATPAFERHFGNAFAIEAGQLAATDRERPQPPRSPDRLGDRSRPGLETGRTRFRPAAVRCPAALRPRRAGGTAPPMTSSAWRARWSSSPTPSGADCERSTS